jgi:hypothetical protein
MSSLDNTPMAILTTFMAIFLVGGAIYDDRIEYIQRGKTIDKQSKLLAHCANGRSIALGDDALIHCTVIELLK